MSHSRTFLTSSASMEDALYSTASIPRAASKSIALYVYKNYQDHETLKLVQIPIDATLVELKREVSRQFCLEIEPNDFSLMILDTATHEWLPIDESHPNHSIVHCNITSYSDLSIRQPIKDQTSSNLVKSHTPSKTVKLRLCKRPMDKMSTIDLQVDSSMTVADLKETARRLVTNQNTDFLYRWTDNGWEKYEADVEDITLFELHFDDYDYISFRSVKYSIPGICGLTNLGATCFINSALQCLSNIRPFTKTILDLDGAFDAPIIGAYTKLIQAMWSGENDIQTPSGLLVNIRESLPKFARYRQQDAQEFMNHFLNRMNQELGDQNTLIPELFHGTMRSTVQCLGGCDNPEINDETISFLPLPVGPEVEQCSLLFLQSNGEQKLVTLPIVSYSRTVGNLIKSFIEQYEMKLSSENIRLVQVQNNEIRREYSTYESIYGLLHSDIAFMEIPTKRVDESHIELRFYDQDTQEPFRPPIYLVRPSYQCPYSHVIDQIDRVRNTLYSLIKTSRPPTNELFWINYEGKLRRLQPEKSNNDYLLLPRYLRVEFNHRWVLKYTAYCKENLSVSKPGLSRLLNSFFQEEILDGDYFCSRCEKLTEAKQKSDLVAPLPPVLIIQLKRFTYDRCSGEKIDTYIEYPLQDLDLHQYTLPARNRTSRTSTSYDLVAVSNHQGSLTSGHYTTYARNYHNGKWYSFNDERCEEITNEVDVVNKNAYILIYVRRDQR